MQSANQSQNHPEAPSAAPVGEDTPAQPPKHLEDADTPKYLQATRAARVAVALLPPQRQDQRAERRARLLPNIILAGLLGSILLLIALWLGGFQLGLLPNPPDQPLLTLSSPGPYVVGNTAILRGTHFAHFSLIALLRDGQPATDAQGLRIAVESDQQGSFTVMLPITADWHTGTHIISAKDTTSQQGVAVTILVANASGGTS